MILRRFIIVIFIFVPSVTSLSFNFSHFDPNNDNSIEYAGDASFSGSGIQLTLNQRDKSMQGSIGRVTYKTPMLLHDNITGALTDFTTNFSFMINSQGNSSFADGMTFFLAPVGFLLPDRSQGKGLGLVSNNQTSKTSEPFVAVEFDTYRNEWDPPYVHVGINVNSMNSSAYVPWCHGIESGYMNNASISYNSSTKLLNVEFNGFCWVRTKLNYTVDLRKVLPDSVSVGFSAQTGILFEIHTLYSWSFSSTSESLEKIPAETPAARGMDGDIKTGKKGTNGLVVWLSVGASILVSGLGLTFVGMYGNNKKKGNEIDNTVVDMSMEDEFEMGKGPKRFSYAELVRATDKFSEEEKLGEGGFGGVYRGYLKEMNCYVAVKRVSKGSKQGIKEYASEVKVISRLRHKNLVQLLGWCHEKGELLLVYEFMSNGSLDTHLFIDTSMLKWDCRYKIACDIAFALCYLHEECDQCVVHRDIKSSNIMLDSSFNAKLGDFGLARFVDHEKGSQTTILAGTLGYMAPECMTTGKSSKESDVYSFGIVVLEIASGRKPFNPLGEKSQRVMVEWIWDLYGMGKLLDATDPKLCGEVNEQQLERLMIVGLWCAHPDFNLRPSIRRVIHVLNFEVPLPNLPSKMPVPTYFPPSMKRSIEMYDDTNTHSSYTYHTKSSQPTSSSSASSTSGLLSLTT